MFFESLEGRRFLSASNGGQSHFPPGQFPAGNPGHAPGNSNSPGNSGSDLTVSLSATGGQSQFPPGQFPAGNPAQAPGNSNSPGNSGK
jgi:hypothetical protein